VMNLTSREQECADRTDGMSVRHIEAFSAIVVSVRSTARG